MNRLNKLSIFDRVVYLKVIEYKLSDKWQ